MNPQPKPVRHVEKSYRDWIKTLPCLVRQRCSEVASCDGVVDPAHMVPKGHAKAGSKVSDRRCVPLCRFHHEIAPGPEKLELMYYFAVEAEIRTLNLIYDALYPPRPKREKAKPNVLQIVHNSVCGKVHRVSKRMTYFCSRLGRTLEV